MKNKISLGGRYRGVCYNFPHLWSRLASRALTRFFSYGAGDWFAKRYGVLVWDTGWVNNTITNVSFNEISGLVGNTGSKTAFTYLALGTSTTAPAAGDTTLTAEITDTGLARKAATVSQVTTTQTNDTLQLATNWTATGTKTVEECGAFNAASSGTMIGHALTGSKALLNTSYFALTYQFIFAAA